MTRFGIASIRLVVAVHLSKTLDYTQFELKIKTATSELLNHVLRDHLFRKLYSFLYSHLSPNRRITTRLDRAGRVRRLRSLLFGEILT